MFKWFSALALCLALVAVGTKASAQEGELTDSIRTWFSDCQSKPI